MFDFANSLDFKGRAGGRSAERGLVPAELLVMGAEGGEKFITQALKFSEFGLESIGASG